MNTLNKTPITEILPLVEYTKQRRAHERKHIASWRRQAEKGKIPGAFQFNDGGPWFVNLDIHDAEVRKRASRQQDDSVDDLAAALGLSPEDIEIAKAAARG